MKRRPHCLKCVHNYRGKAAAFNCLLGKDPDNCDRFELQTHCCFDCREYQVVDKSCNLHKEVPGAFIRHACSEFEREVTK